MADKGKKGKAGKEPTIENRRARHDYFIEDTLECGIQLVGTEVKSIRQGQVSLGEGYIRATESPLALTAYGIHIAEYPPAGEHRQHAPARARPLLAHRRQIRKLAARTRDRGTTLVPLKMYFVDGRVKLLIGVARGRRRTDKREEITKRETKREMERATSKRRR
jgi:SsrA-binding protein